MIILCADSRIHIGPYKRVGPSAEQEFYHLVIRLYYSRVQGAPTEGERIDVGAAPQKGLNGVW